MLLNDLLGAGERERAMYLKKTKEEQLLNFPNLKKNNFFLLFYQLARSAAVYFYCIFLLSYKKKRQSFAFDQWRD